MKKYLALALGMCLIFVGAVLYFWREIALALILVLLLAGNPLVLMLLPVLILVPLGFFVLLLFFLVPFAFQLYTINKMREPVYEPDGPSADKAEPTHRGRWNTEGHIPTYGIRTPGKEEATNTMFLGAARKELKLAHYHNIIQSYPQVRFAPVSKWQWADVNFPFFLDMWNEVNPHINISGASGYGKSTLCKTLLTGITSTLKIPVTVLDVHNEFVEYVKDSGGNIYSPREICLNIWELDGLSPSERAGENIEMFKRIRGLGEIQAYNLLKCAENAYKRKGICQEDKGTWNRTPPTMKDIAESMELMLADSKMSRNASLLGLNKRLHSILMCTAFSNKTTVPFEEVVTCTSNFTLGDLRSSEAQALFIETFLRKLYSHMLSRNMVRGVCLYVLIDEAHKVCISSPDELSLPGRLVAEGRKYGIGIITSNQMAKALDRSIVGNSAVTFAFHQKEPQEEEYVSNLMACGSENSRKEEVKIALRNLKQFEALAITSEMRNPLRIQIVRPWETGMQNINENAKPEHERISTTNTGAENAEAQMNELRSVILGKLELGVFRLSEISEELCLKDGSLQAIINDLMRESLVECGEFENLYGFSEFWIGRKRGDKSLEHSAYVSMIAELLSSLQIPRTIYDSMNMPDIVAEVNGKEVAIEYETGKKKDMNSVKEMLAGRAKDYRLVLVVMTEENIARYVHMCMNTGVNVVEIRKVMETIGKLKDTE